MDYSEIEQKIEYIKSKRKQLEIDNAIDVISSIIVNTFPKHKSAKIEVGDGVIRVIVEKEYMREIKRN